MTNFTSWPTISSVKKYRTAKYKQRRVLYETGWIENDNLKVGACTGLSYRWISLHKKAPSQSASSRTRALKPSSIFSSIAYFAEIFNSSDGGSSYEARITNTAKFALGSSTGPIVTESDNVGFSKFTQLRPGYYVIYMELRHASGNTNHVCAGFQSGGEFTFFDPNSGEYKVKNADLKHFLQELVKQYRGYVTAKGKRVEVTIKQWLIAPVSPA